MKILVVGKGGREHAISWKISKSPLVEKIYCAPGNAGISEQAECVDINSEDIGGLKNFALKEKIDLIVVGPEAPLVKGIVDEFESIKLPIFGPTKEAAKLEGSKVFAKNIMRKYGVLTPDFEVFEDSEEAISYIKSKGTPIVVKADGLASGKGVFVCKSYNKAIDAIKRIMVDREFGDAGGRVVVEEYLDGEEASILAFTDGENIKLLPSSQDHKPIYDGDRGPNTGGMGAYSPAPLVKDEILGAIEKDIVKRTIDALRKEGILYRGILYAGLMIRDGKPYVLEFNVRFGDPEIQAILPRMDSDIIPPIMTTIDGNLKKIDLKWREDSCVCVVVSSSGYPESYEKGKVIEGLKSFKDYEDVVVFHAGTKRLKDGRIVTDGGRVFSISALGKDIREAIRRVYKAVDCINFENMYYRKDIGYKALRC